MSSSLKRPVCTVAFSCISSSPLRTSLLSSPLSSSSSSSPLFLSLQRTLAIMTKIQKIEYDKEQARIARRVEEEKLSKKVQIPPSALGTLSTEELLKKNILHVPAPDAPFSEVYPGFIASLEKPVPWMRNENELKSGVKIDPLPWTEKSVRVGAVGRKMGMMHLWDHWGIQYPVTVIKIDSTVIHVHPHINEKTGLIGVQMGSGFVNPKKIKKPQMGHFKKAAVFPKHRLVEFQCTPDAVLPIGHVMSVRHFVPGQWLDVRGTSIGKGYQGAMKRWNFKGLPATHGVSVTHRSLGSTGSAQDPARVFKGKKMAGHLGNERVTQLNVRLFKIDTLRNLLFVVGTVPGHKNNYVVVRDAIKKKFTPSNPPPFPTYVIKAGDENVKEIVMQHSLLDPEDEDN